MTKIFLSFLAILFIACKNDQNKHFAIQETDLIMGRYFNAVDSLPYSDTLDEKFKLLKAYHNNDTAYLTASYNEIANLLKYRDEMLESHICEEPIPLNTLKHKEAYRFSYDATFCNKAVNMTIGKSGDNITIDLYLFEFNDKQTACKTIQRTTKLVPKTIWDTLINGIHQADFWGLKEDNGRHGMDGSRLRVTGYERPINAFEGRYKTIYRWAAEKMAVGILFKKLLELSNTKVDCFHY